MLPVVTEVVQVHRSFPKLEVNDLVVGDDIGVDDDDDARSISSYKAVNQS
jgi:hypothetical protein